MHWLHHRCYIVEHKVCSVTSEPTQSSSRRVSSLKDSSVLLTTKWWTSQKWSPSNRWHTACGEDGKYISEHKQNAHNNGHCLLRMGGIWKIKKRGWKYGEGAGLLKKEQGGWNFSYLAFSRFIIFTFRNYFRYPLDTKIVMHLEKKIFLSP